MNRLEMASNPRRGTRRSDLIELGINIDHVATLRQARGTSYPQPAHAVLIAEQSGADLITLHLREDRRHIVDKDVSRAERASVHMTLIGISCPIPSDILRAI